MGGHRKRALEPYRAFLLEQLATGPDLTMPALVAELADLGVVAHPVTVWRRVRSQGLRLKKSCSPSSRTGRRLRVAGHSRKLIKVGLIRVAWSSCLFRRSRPPIPG